MLEEGPIAPPTADRKPRSLLDVIDRFRQNMSPEELGPNAEDIWQDARIERLSPVWLGEANARARHSLHVQRTLCI
jgi:hypothetical protein